MSRSYLHSKFMREYYKSNTKNPHKLDELPKNNPSKHILSHCDNWKIKWIEKTPFCRGHYRPKNYHNIINGIVRAKIKEEDRQIINEQILDSSL